MKDSDLVHGFRIPELADSINLQASGYDFARVREGRGATDRYLRPTEASRALRKKLKHGNSHQQYRSMVVRVFSLSLFPIVQQVPF
jgi:hypothetical protein